MMPFVFFKVGGAQPSFFSELDSRFLWLGLCPVCLCEWHLGHGSFGEVCCNVCLAAVGRGLVLSVRLFLA